jgi:hypothetical protein
VTDTNNRISAGEQMLLTWGMMTPHMAARDAQVVDILLAEGGPLTQADIVAKADERLYIGTWTWRRLSTGHHKDAVRGPALIVRVTDQGVKKWALTDAAVQASLIHQLAS